MTPSPHQKGRQGLLPCPFCGEPAITHGRSVARDPRRIISSGNFTNQYSIDCRNNECIAGGPERPFYDSEQEAIAAWNRRADRWSAFEDQELLDLFNDIGIRLPLCDEIKKAYEERLARRSGGKEQ